MQALKLIKESDLLQREAKSFLRKHKIEKHLKTFGKVHFTGSFAANLMTSGDVDVYVIGEWTAASVRKVYDVLLNKLNVKSWFLYNFVKYRDPRFPKAWYIGIKDKYRGQKWKIDIWFLTNKQLKRIPFSNWDNVVITPVQRAAILTFKNYRKEKNLEIFSHLIYQAVLQHDLLSQKDIMRFCLAMKTSEKSTK